MKFPPLPEDALITILKRMSSRPRATNWRGFMNLEDIHSVLLTNGPLVSTARRVFSDLHFHVFLHGPDKKMYIAFSQYPGEIPDEYVFQSPYPPADICVTFKASGTHTDSKYRLVEEIIDQLESSVTSLTLTGQPLLGTGKVRSAQHFTNLRRLSVTSDACLFDLNCILGANSGQLRSLAIGGKSITSSTVDALAKYCHGLEKLYMRYDTAECCLTAVWKSIGPTLEQLSLIEPYTVDGATRHMECCITGISKYCLVVKKVADVRDDFYYYFPMSLVEAFGSQLRVVRMMGERSCKYPTELEKVKRASPFSVFDVFITADLPDTLEVLGDRLRTLKLFGEDFEALVHVEAEENDSDDEPELSLCDGVEESIAKALVRCTAIEELIIGPIVVLDIFYLMLDDIFSAVLSTPKPRLTKVSIDLTQYSPCGAEFLLDTLAETATHIEHISVHGLPLEEECSRKFAAANKQLKSFNLYETYVSGGNEQEFVSSVLNVLKYVSQCPALEELFIDCPDFSSRYEQIADACVPLRFRNIDVYIAGHQYNR